MRAALVFLVALLAAVSCSTTANGSRLSFATRVAASPEVSSNWSGYALIAPDPATPLGFSDVTGTWIQPKVTCTLGRQDASAFWVGLGGYDETSVSLEQLGTAAECTGNSKTPQYYAWWELVPAASVQIPMRIMPGDRIVAAVLVRGQTITYSLRDVTRHTRFSKVLTTTQTLDVDAAEWIAEAPSSCSSFGRCSVIPLTNFGSVTFTNVAATANDHPGTLADATWAATPIELITRASDSASFGGIEDTFGPGVGAVPGDVSADGRTFSVGWQRNVAMPTTG